MLLPSAPNLALRLETILQNLWHYALTHLKFYQINFLNCENHAWKFLKQLILEREVLVDCGTEDLLLYIAEVVDFVGQDGLTV